MRLYNFNGKKVHSNRTIVLLFEERKGTDNVNYKIILDKKTFSSYKEAADFVEQQQIGNYRIVGTDPFVSPVDLDELQTYEMIYASESNKEQTATGEQDFVKVFQYKGE